MCPFRRTATIRTRAPRPAPRVTRLSPTTARCALAAAFATRGRISPGVVHAARSRRAPTPSPVARPTVAGPPPAFASETGPRSSQNRSFKLSLRVNTFLSTSCVDLGARAGHGPLARSRRRRQRRHHRWSSRPFEKNHQRRVLVRGGVLLPQGAHLCRLRPRSGLAGLHGRRHSLNPQLLIPGVRLVRPARALQQNRSLAMLPPDATGNRSADAGSHHPAIRPLGPAGPTRAAAHTTAAAPAISTRHSPAYGRQLPKLQQPALPQRAVPLHAHLLRFRVPQREPHPSRLHRRVRAAQIRSAVAAEQPDKPSLTVWRVERPTGPSARTSPAPTRRQLPNPVNRSQFHCGGHTFRKTRCSASFAAGPLARRYAPHTLVHTRSPPHTLVLLEMPSLDLSPRQNRVPAARACAHALTAAHACAQTSPVPLEMTSLDHSHHVPDLTNPRHPDTPRPGHSPYGMRQPRFQVAGNTTPSLRTDRLVSSTARLPFRLLRHQPAQRRNHRSQPLHHATTLPLSGTQAFRSYNPSLHRVSYRHSSQTHGNRCCSITPIAGLPRGSLTALGTAWTFTFAVRAQTNPGSAPTNHLPGSTRSKFLLTSLPKWPPGEKRALSTTRR